MGSALLPVETPSVMGMPSIGSGLPESMEKRFFDGRFSERDLADQVTLKWKESDDRLRDFFLVALECWDIYRNKQDFSEKEDWQARVVLAKGHSAVKQGVANIRKLLSQSGRFLEVDDPSDRNSFFAPYVREGVHRVWEQADFLSQTSEALEAGLIMGLIAAREDWVFDDIDSVQAGIGQDGNPALFNVTTKEGRLSYRAIDPWSLRWGPETGPRKIDWIIEQQMVSIPTLLRMGFSLPPEVIRENKRTDERESQEQRRKDEREPREPFEKRVELKEYWGNLIDKESQEIVVKDAHVIIANDQFVVVAEPNQLWRKKPPYVLASPLRVAFRFPGQGILEVNRALKANIDSIIQMGTDYLKFSTLPMFEADMSMLENPEDLATGIEPGKMFRKRPGTNMGSAVAQVQVHPLTGDVFNMLLGLDKEFQRGTFITDIVQGQIDIKGETTATEVSQSFAQSTVMLSSMAYDLENQFIEPLADLTWDLMFQFMDSTSSPNWERLIGPQGRKLDVLSRPERVAVIQGNYTFRARGISAQVEKLANLQKLVNYIQVIGQFGPMFIPLVNLPELFKRIHESFAFDRPDLLLAPNALQLFPQLQQNLVAQNSPAEQVAGQVLPELVRGLVAQATAPPASKGESNG